MVQWQTLKGHGFVPEPAKGVKHKARNGILLCSNHQIPFIAFCYYICWVPEVGYSSLNQRLALTCPTQERRFVFINHSRIAELEIYHKPPCR